MAIDYTYRNTRISNSVTGQTTVVPKTEIDPNIFNNVIATETYTVTEADVLAALANNGNLAPRPITVSCDGEQGTIVINNAKNVLNVYKPNLIQDMYEPFVTVEIRGIDPTFAYAVGDTFNYTFRIVNNTATTIRNLVVTSLLTNTSQTVSLDPHETKNVDFSYTTVLDDAYAETLSIAVQANGTSFASTSISASATQAFLVEKANPKVQLSYTSSTGTGYILASSGTTVNYVAKVTNTGNVPISSGTFHDNRTNADYTFGYLNTGASTTFNLSTAFNVSNSIEEINGIVSAVDTKGKNAAATNDFIYCYVDRDAPKISYQVEVSNLTERRTGIPFILDGQPNVVLSVDWGDETNNVLRSSDYSSGNSKASIHTYENEGTYTINIISQNFENAYINTANATSKSYENLYYFKNTVTDILEPLPKLKGCYISSNNGSNYTATSNAFSYLFYGCSRLKSIPEGIFNNNKHISNFTYCFSSCSKLSSSEISPHIFAKNTSITNLEGVFSSSDLITDLHLVIDSENVSSFTKFINNRDDARRRICVPENTTTYNSFTTYNANVRDAAKLTISTLHHDCEYPFVFTVNTAATTSNAKTATIPVRFSGQNNTSTLMIDWGDGNGTELIPSQTTDANLTHEYSEAGTYQITVASLNWLDYEFATDSALYSSDSLVQTFRNTLVSIDDPIPQMSNTSLDYWFQNCTHLQSHANRLLKNYPNVTTAIATFKNCSSLTRISASVLQFQIELLNASSCFEGCSTASYIPSGLLSRCTKLTTIDRMFKNCTALTYYPSTLLLNNTLVSSRNGMFDGCSNTNPTMYTVAEMENAGHIVELYDTAATYPDYAKVGVPVFLHNQSSSISVNWGNGATRTFSPSEYNNSSNLAYSQVSIYSYGTNPGLYFVDMSTSGNNWENIYLAINSSATSSDVPRTISDGERSSAYLRETGLIQAVTKLPKFKGVTKVPNPYWTDTGTYDNTVNDLYNCCRKLESISQGHFDNLTNITAAVWTFHYCRSLKSIPVGLFDNNVNITDFRSCFYLCSSLTSIPAGLFDYTPGVTTFKEVFYGCSGITSIPSDLFKYNTEVENMSYALDGMGLSTIPENIFAHNTKITSFEYALAYNRKIKSVPENIFAHNTLATSFYGCFSGCNSLETIPENLFKYNTAATSFYYAFIYCYSLKSIPENLFAHNTANQTFNYTFSDCYSLETVPENIFANNTAVTGFQYTFQNCYSLRTIPANIFVNNTAVTSFYSTFYNCSGLNNFSIHIGSSNVSSASYFCPNKSGTTRTVYVPSGSTTQTSFNNVASSYGLTVIGE